MTGTIHCWDAVSRTFSSVQLCDGFKKETCRCDGDADL